MRLLTALSLCALAAAFPAAAAELPATSIVDAVTVFPQGAEVTRMARVKVEAGSHVVVLKDLPAGLLPDSIRVQGEGSGNLVIGSVDSRPFYLSEEQNDAAKASERKRLEDELQDLQDRQQALTDAVAAAETQKTLISNLTALPSKPEPAQATGVTRGPDDWGQIYTLIGEKLAEANKTIQDLRVALRDVQKKINDVQNQLNTQPAQADQRTELKINVAADTPFEATLRVRYQVPSAYWSPLYDARLETGDKTAPPKLMLVRRAVVMQQTGEDWTDVVLTLSTTRPQEGTSAPELQPLAVDFREEYDKKLAKMKARAKSGEEKQDRGEAQDQVSAVGGADMQEAAPVATAQPEAPPKPATEQNATILTSAFQAIYVIDGRQTVKSQEGEKRVQIDSISVEPLLMVRTVPKVTPVAYLYAQYKLDPGLMVLPGPASLFRDGVFVGHGALPLISGGEDHELGFGIDDQVRVKFNSLGRKAGETGIISSSRTDTQPFKLTIKNNHERDMSIRVFDQVPISANEEIKVELLPNSDKPTQVDVDDKRGIYAWDLKLAAQAEQDINFGYVVTWPKAKEIEYSGGPYPVPY